MEITSADEESTEAMTDFFPLNAVEMTIVSSSSRLQRSAMEKSLNTAIIQLEKISRLRSK